MDVIYHPFIDGEVFLLRAPDEETYREVHVLDDPEGLAEVREWIRGLIDRADSVDGLLSLISKNYRLNYLEAVKHLLSCDDLAKMLKEIWMTLDGGDFYTLKNALDAESLLETFETCNLEILMGESDYKYYQNLPDKLTIYRGIIDDDDEAYINSLSWTLNIDVAVRFANKYRNTYGRSHLYRAEIRKPCVFAYFSDRNEETVIVNPYGLIDAEEIEELH